MSTPTDSTSFDFRYLVKGLSRHQEVSPPTNSPPSEVTLPPKRPSSTLFSCTVYKILAPFGMCKLMHIHTSHWMRTRHIFRFSRSGKREVDVNHNSDYSVTIDVSLQMKLMHTRTDFPRFDKLMLSLAFIESFNAHQYRSYK